MREITDHRSDLVGGTRLRVLGHAPDSIPLPRLALLVISIQEN